MFKNLSPWALGISGHESELIELALTFGFAGMDLQVAEYATRVKLHGIPYSRRLVDSAKIRLGTFRLPFDLDIDEELFKKEVERLPEYAQVAAAVDCTRCVVTLPPASDQRPYHENFELHRRRLAEVCAGLGTSGVWLGVGFQAAEFLRKDRPFQFIHDLDALGLLLKMVDAPNIGLLLDVWDVFVAGGSLDTIRGLSPDQIVAVQVAGVPADVPPSAFDKNSRLLPGAENSLGNTAGVLALLAESGFAGPVTPNPSRAAFQSRRRDIIVKQAGEAMDRVWRAANLTGDGTPAARAVPAQG